MVIQFLIDKIQKIIDIKKDGTFRLESKFILIMQQALTMTST
jgi:hypothetical protein